MDHVLGNENFHSLLIYLDDVLVFRKSVDEMLQRLDTVLCKLLDSRLSHSNVANYLVISCLQKESDRPKPNKGGRRMARAKE